MDDVGIGILSIAAALTPGAAPASHNSAATRAADDVRQALALAIGPARFDSFFGPGVHFSQSEAGALEVSTPSLLERNLLRDRFGAELSEVYRRLTQGAGRVVFKTAEDTEALRDPVVVQRVLRAPTPTTPRQSPPSGWSEFLESSSNAAALRMARQVAQGRPTGSPLLLWGSTGVGKTCLLRGLKESARLSSRRRRILALTAEQFTTGFVEALQGRGLPNFRHKHRGVELFILDDLQFFVGKKKTGEEFLYTLDQLLQAGAQVVLTADRPPAELAGLGDELVSRLRGGMAVEIGPADAELRRQLVDRLLTQRGITLADSARSALSGAISGGAREITGAINRLQVLHELVGAPLDEAHALAAADEVNRASTPQVQLADIEHAVCEVFGMCGADLKGTKRTKAATEPRMLAMWLARKYTRAAWSEIGAHFGRRSHSTVIAAHRRVEELLADGATLKAAGGASNLQEAIRRVEIALRRA